MKFSNPCPSLNLLQACDDRYLFFLRISAANYWMLTFCLCCLFCLGCSFLLHMYVSVGWFSLATVWVFYRVDVSPAHLGICRASCITVCVCACVLVVHTHAYTHTHCITLVVGLLDGQESSFSWHFEYISYVYSFSGFFLLPILLPMQATGGGGQPRWWSMRFPCCRQRHLMFLTSLPGFFALGMFQLNIIIVCTCVCVYMCMCVCM